MCGCVHSICDMNISELRWRGGVESCLLFYTTLFELWLWLWFWSIFPGFPLFSPMNSFNFGECLIHIGCGCAVAIRQSSHQSNHPILLVLFIFTLWSCIYFFKFIFTFFIVFTANSHAKTIIMISFQFEGIDLVSCAVLIWCGRWCLDQWMNFGRETIVEHKYHRLRTAFHI